MSLLDDVSIVVTPNGYKASTLYGVLPTYAEGSEEVTYPNFTNSDISQWKIASSRATKSWNASEFMRLTYDAASGSALYATFGNTLNVVYKVTMRVRGTKADGTTAQGSAFSSIGDNDELGRVVSNPTLTSEWQDYEFYTVVTGSTFRLYLASAVIGDLVDFDSISVKEVTSSDMDVTRATASTRVDENGLVNYAEVLGSELVTDGGFPTGTTAWSITNNTGTNTRIENNHLIIETDGTYTQVIQSNVLEIGKNYKLVYDVTATDGGNLGLETGGATSLIPSTIGTHTFYWVSNSTTFNLKRYSGALNITIDNVSVKEADRNNVPRIDYTGGGCPHILAEPQRTNLITYSEDFTQSAWTKTNVDVSNNTELAPSGTLTATRTIISSTGTDLRTQCNVIALSNYTFSFYAKKGTSTDITYRVYDVSNGSNIVSPTNYYSQLSTDWERVSLNFTTPSGCTSVFVYLTSDSVEIGDIYLWGAQLELGSYPTSYIPTSGSTVTRNQDVFTRDGIGSLINSTEGVFFVEMAALSDDGTSRRMSLSDGSISNRVSLEIDETAGRIRVHINASLITYDTSNLTSFNKIAVKYKVNDYALWLNGVEVATSTSSEQPSGMNQLFLSNPTGSQLFFGKVRQLQVYDTALTDNQLIQLTGEAGTHFFESYSEMAESLTYTIQ